MGIKPKTSFRHCIPTRYSRWAALHPTHIPRLPKKKPLRGKKVGFAEKKLRLQQIMAHRVYQGWCVPTCEWLATTDPLKAHCFGCGLLPPSCARLCLACMSTIRHLRRRFVCDYCGLWVSGGRSWQMGSLRSTFGFAFPARMRNFFPLR